MSAGLVMAMWLGTFEPSKAEAACAECTAPKIEAHDGFVRVLSPSDNTPPATGDVVVVSPLLGVIAHGKVDHGKIAVPWFNYDRRDSADGVVVLPGDAEPRL